LKYKEFGWNDFVLEVPKDMRFASEGGSIKSGYMRLEAEDFSFEFKWEPFQTKKTKPISEVADGFIRELEKNQKLKISVRKKGSTHLFQHKALFINFKSTIEERVFLWYCEESNRIIISRFAFKSIDNTSQRIIKRVLSSFKCHGQDAALWSVLGFSFKAPTSFQLTDRKMTVGRAYFLLLEQKATPFAERRREILFEYFSMANITFEEDYMNFDKWMEKHYFKDLKKRYRKIKFQSSTSEKVIGHKALVKEGFSISGFTTRKSSLYNNIVWYCPDSNRIYSITISTHVTRPLPLKREIDREDFKKFVQETLSSVECH